MIPFNWHGYIPSDVGTLCETRPWWRYQSTAPEDMYQWKRNDGPVLPRMKPARNKEEAISCLDLATTNYDTEHPLPAPPPRCGQVWWSNAEERAFLLTSTNGTESDYVFIDIETYGWPPFAGDCILVHGPGAPWAPHAMTTK